jgi:hypothetical protein
MDVAAVPLSSMPYNHHMQRHLGRLVIAVSVHPLVYDSECVQAALSSSFLSSQRLMQSVA